MEYIMETAKENRTCTPYQKGRLEIIQGNDVIVKGVYHRRVCFYKSKHLCGFFFVECNVYIMMHKKTSCSDVLYYAVKIS